MVRRRGKMLLSDEWFAGGVSHKGMDGIFAMKLHEHDKYNGSLRARKSFFAFDDRIIALGSGLENGLEGSELHTTLFQNSLPDNISDTFRTIADSLTIICDRFGNTFFVKEAFVVLSRGMQHSFHEETAEPTSGRFEKAYIRHGDIVRDGHYEYMTVIHATPEQIEEYMGEQPYLVTRCDEQAHIVEDRTSGTKGFAVFENIAEGDDEILAEATPSLIMYSCEGGEMTLSVSNPDLAIYSGPSDEVFDADGKRMERSIYGRDWVDDDCQPTSVILTLNGEWTVSDCGDSEVKVSHEDGNTVLVIMTREAGTEEMTLEQK